MPSSASSSQTRFSPRSPSFPGPVGGLRLPSRSTVFFFVSCLAWYLSSALSSNTSKALLSVPKAAKLLADPRVTGSATTSIPDAADIAAHHIPKATAPFPYPVSLTFIQFLFVAGFCYLCTSETLLGSRRLSRPVPPTRDRVIEVGQLSVFAVVGHIFSSVAISRVPVATVHTIKALSPLVTVVAYSVFFSIVYSPLTWLSLVPLTLGVMIACSGLSLSASDVLGVATSLGSTMVFVAQNIYSKKLLNASGHGSGSRDKDREISTADGGATRKLDKINILLYSNACAAVLMIPLVFYHDVPLMLRGGKGAATSAMQVPVLLLCNGIVQFAQNLLAINVLALVSPVTYSVASLLKRVFVIITAIIWFRQPVTRLQWVGIFLTFVGLYLYNSTKAKQDVSAGEERLRRRADGADLSLPTSSNGYMRANGGAHAYPAVSSYEPRSQRPHMSVSKITGAFIGAGSSNGHAGPGSWYRSDPSSSAGGTAPQESHAGHDKYR